MTYMLVTKLKQLTSGQFVRNVGWLGGAELANRVFRLGTTVTLARMFSLEDYGLMAVIYTTIEFARMFTLRGGIGAKIIQADAKDVRAIADTAYWLNWILCGIICAIQCIAAFPIARFYGKQQLILPLCVAALPYLIFPLYMVNAALIERENRLKITAIANAVSSLLVNLTTIVFALLGVGVWAVVWPMIITAPVWVFITWSNHSWRPPKNFKLSHWREIVKFGGSLLGIDLVNKLRGTVDYLIIGKVLGAEALGVYYFAFNAGLGISLNVMNSLNSAIFPYLCEARENFEIFKERFFSILKKTSLIMIPLILLQSGLAFFYVPIIFGEKWVPAIPVLILICLSALPFPLAYAVSNLLNAMGEVRLNFYWNSILTAIFTIFVLALVRFGIFWVGVAALITQIPALIFCIWVIRKVFKK